MDIHLFFSILPSLDAPVISRYYPYTIYTRIWLFSMMKQLRGRNLAHPGCLIGVTIGLIIGIILAGILASVFNIILNTILFIWLGLTVGLGLIGWIVGASLTSRFAARESEDAAQNPSH
jgi:hypothetical protein